MAPGFLQYLISVRTKALALEKSLEALIVAVAAPATDAVRGICGAAAPACASAYGSVAAAAAGAYGAAAPACAKACSSVGASAAQLAAKVGSAAGSAYGGVSSAAASGYASISVPLWLRLWIAQSQALAILSRHYVKFVFFTFRGPFFFCFLLVANY